MVSTIDKITDDNDFLVLIDISYFIAYFLNSAEILFENLFNGLSEPDSEVLAGDTNSILFEVPSFFVSYWVDKSFIKQSIEFFFTLRFYSTGIECECLCPSDVFVLTKTLSTININVYPAIANNYINGYP